MASQERRNEPPGAGDLLRGLAAGLVAGIAASYAMNGFQSLANRLSEPEDEARGSQDEKPDPDPTTVKAASKVSEGAFGHRLSSGEKRIAEPAVHYGVGAALGGLYGMTAELAPQVTAGAGLPFGAAVDLVLDEAVVPALGLSGAPWDTPAPTHVYALASHLVFGLTAEMVRRGTRGVIG